MKYKLLIDSKVIKDLKKIVKSWQIKIIDTIKTKLTKNQYIGKKLVGDLSKYYRLIVGDYRVIYSIDHEIITIEVIKIKYRKDVYK